jgi:sRNA-binding carbon storage regulator CsrA
MLALHRTPGESVTIFLPDGRTILISVGKCKDSGVMIGFEADRDIAIHRTEVTQRPDFVQPSNEAGK